MNRRKFLTSAISVATAAAVSPATVLAAVTPSTVRFRPGPVMKSSDHALDAYGALYRFTFSEALDADARGLAEAMQRFREKVALSTIKELK